MELLSDNGPCFTSVRTTQVLQSWGVKQLFSCAYKHSGNGIVERNHRTIKRMVARTNGTVAEMLHWYNNTPNSENVVPAQAIYQYSPRLVGEEIKDLSLALRSTALSPYQVGDMVYVKPPKARCDTVWKLGKVTQIVADAVVEVDGTNRHVADVRHAYSSSDEQSLANNIQSTAASVEFEIHSDNNDHETSDDSSSCGTDREGVTEMVNSGDNHVTRDRRPPQWLADFYVFD